MGGQEPRGGLPPMTKESLAVFIKVICKEFLNLFKYTVM